MGFSRQEYCSGVPLPSPPNIYDVAILKGNAPPLLASLKSWKAQQILGVLGLVPMPLWKLLFYLVSEPVPWMLGCFDVRFVTRAASL